MVGDYVYRRRQIERDINLREADRFIHAQYKSLFQEDPPVEMSPVFIACRIASYLGFVGKLASQKDITEGDVKMLTASWGERAKNNDYRDFDEDLRICFQSDILRRNEMAIAKKNGLVEEVVKAPKAELTPAEFNAKVVARCDKWYARQGKDMMEKIPLYADTQSRFRPGNKRQLAYEHIRAYLKTKKIPQNFQPMYDSLPAEFAGDKGYLDFAIGCHRDVFEISEDNKISVVNPFPEMKERSAAESEDEKKEKKIAKAEKVVLAKKAATDPVTPPAKKSAVLLKKKKVEEESAEESPTTE